MPTTRARLTSRVDDAVTVLAAIRDQHPRPRVPNAEPLTSGFLLTDGHGSPGSARRAERSGSRRGASSRRDRAGTPVWHSAPPSAESTAYFRHRQAVSAFGSSGSGCRGRFTSWTLPARRPGVSPGCSTPRREGRSSRRQVYGCPFHSERFLAGAIICQRPLQPPSGFLPGAPL